MRFVRLLPVLLLLAACSGPAPDERDLPLAELRDKVAGGWAGQMIGVSYGAPTEFRFNDEIIEKDIEWRPDMVDNALVQDDLYVDMTFVKVLDTVGLDATTADFGAEFKNAKYRLWHANLAARRALRRGVPAELSGTPKYNIHANDIDFQIEADFAGLMAPGMPRSTNQICDRAGRVMNYGDGLYGGMFVSGMYAAAYFEKDPRKIVEAGLATIPAESIYAQVIRDTLDWSAQHPDDWRAVWRLIEDKWANPEVCPNGALRPFNIDASVNGSYIAVGLLYGGGDFGKTVEITTRLGKDSDCNPASAGGILGVVLGYQAIPDGWKSGIAAIENDKFDYTDYSFKTIVDSTVDRAVKLAEANGGSLQGDTLRIKLQQPEPAPLEQWTDWGKPVERIELDDPRWKFSGAWRDEQAAGRGARVSDKAKSRAEVTFSGTGVIVSGPYLPTGGKAEIFLDGQSQGVVDAYQDGEAGAKRSESLWHQFGLAPGEHRLEVVVLGEPIFDSPGSDIGLEALIVFAPRE